MPRELKISVGQFSDKGLKETNQDFHGVLIPDEPLLSLKGISVVLANKGPMVLAFRELHETAARTGAGLKYSATVCGGLPVLTGPGFVTKENAAEIQKLTEAGTR